MPEPPRDGTDVDAAGDELGRRVVPQVVEVGVDAEAVRNVTSLRRVRNCGTPLDPDGGVTLALTTSGDGARSAGYSGLASCGSVWACPQCAAKVATRRADELSKVMRAVDEAGGSAFLLTLTMRHSRGGRLGLSKEERARLRRLGENRAGYDAANANGWDFDERQAEADAIEAPSC